VSVLSREERCRFDEIVRRIEQEPAAMDVCPVPKEETTAVVPVRLAAFGLFAVGLTGLLTGLAKDELVVLVLVGVVPVVAAVVLLAAVGTRHAGAATPAEPAVSMVRRCWLWLTTCAEKGCGKPPVHLGWCGEHAPGPEEYWGDQDVDRL
jgi:uncharacterized protein (TIGR04222 family)